MATQVLHVEVTTADCKKNEAYIFDLPLDISPTDVCTAVNILYGHDDVSSIHISVVDVEEK